MRQKKEIQRGAEAGEQKRQGESLQSNGGAPPRVRVTLCSSRPVALEGMLDVEAEQAGGPVHRFRLQVLGACQ